MENRNVLVVGASVAGPALAYWLHRYGFDVTVAERAPALRLGGQAVDIRGVAREVVERMGLAAEIRRAHTGARGLAFVDAAGRSTATVPVDLLGHSGGAVAEIEITRGDLVRILHEATRADAEYVFGDGVIGLDQDDDGVTAHFVGGADRRFDLVVGADGLHSGVRAAVFGPEASYVRPLGSHLAIFATRSPVPLDGWWKLYSDPVRGGARTAGLYPIGVDGEARAMFFFDAPPPEFDRHDPVAGREFVADRFRGAGWVVPALLDAMWDVPDFHLDAASQVHMPRWSKGRVVLAGDAAHCPAPLSGMGTSLALVGAYVLAGELASAGGEYRPAFARYRHEMADYVERCQRLALDNTPAILPGSRTAVWVRDRTTRMLPWMRHLPRLPWASGDGTDEAASALTLRDYAARAGSVERMG
ncbi:FAD-dependent monooxygenase [Embleya sp. NPDC020630]|uniref:FAD-dependent monooxygenase n=1 Tax=Embleya sp. NPDC020630 TaxID=3363979 RepID=UPI0037AD8885